MKKTKILIATAILGIATFVAIAADHIDAPATQGDSSSDITDFYAFQGADNSNIAFIANLQPLLGAGAPTQNATFNENVMIEFNIDNTGDNVEDLVIQAVARDGKMYVFGPTAPSQGGLNSSIVANAANQVVVDITPSGQSAIVESSGGIMAFAGPRDDPFFMDFNRYGEIIGGSATSFNNPGMDTFAGSNVMSIVVEVPKSMIGGSGTINTWVESKIKQ
jgi:hypothetical protein